MLKLLCVGILWMCRSWIDDPPEYFLRDYVDVTEVNQVFDRSGECAFRQFLFYEWDVASQRLRIRAWRPLHTPEVPMAVDPRTGQSVLVFFDGGAIRVIRSVDHWHSDSTNDVERQEKKLWPASDRIGLLPLR